VVFFKGPLKQKQTKNKQRTKKESRQKATDRLSFFSFFCGLSAIYMRVGCGHATAQDHPQLVVVSSFTS
jgi:hypothetical protein